MKKGRLTAAEHARLRARGHLKPPTRRDPTTLSWNSSNGSATLPQKQQVSNARSASDSTQSSSSVLLQSRPKENVSKIGKSFQMPSLDLLEINWLAELLLPQMTQRKAVICRSLAELQEDLDSANMLVLEAHAAKHVHLRQRDAIDTSSAGSQNVTRLLDPQIASSLLPLAKKLTEKVRFAQNALKVSLEHFAVAERHLKLAQVLGDLDIEKAEELVQVWYD